MPDNHAGPPPKQNVSLGMTLLFSEIVISMGISALVKQISGDVSFLVIMFYRYLASLPLLFLLGGINDRPTCYRSNRLRHLLSA